MEAIQVERAEPTVGQRKEDFVRKLYKSNPDLSHKGVITALMDEFDSSMANAAIANIRRGVLGIKEKPVKRQHTKKRVQRKAKRLTTEQLKLLTEPKLKLSKGLTRAIQMVQSRFEAEGIQSITVLKSSAKVAHVTVTEVAT